MAQTVSRRSVSVESRVRCGDCGGQTGSGTSFSQTISVCLLTSSRQAPYSYFFHVPPIRCRLGSLQHSYTKHNSLSISLSLSPFLSLSLSLSIDTVRVSDGLHFQLFRRILKDIRSTTKAQSLEW